MSRSASVLERASIATKLKTALLPRVDICRAVLAGRMEASTYDEQSAKVAKDAADARQICEGRLWRLRRGEDANL